jgi:hypothetical protein
VKNPWIGIIGGMAEKAQFYIIITIPVKYMVTFMIIVIRRKGIF